MEQAACVDSCANPYVSRNLCRKMGLLWIQHGKEVLLWMDDQVAPPLREKPGDDMLTNVLKLAG